MAKNIYVKSKTGKTVRLLNPSQKGKKYAHELEKGFKFTNMGEVKTDKKGHPKRLTDLQRAYRSGYLTARSDNAKAYKHNLKKGK